MQGTDVILLESSGGGGGGIIIQVNGVLTAKEAGREIVEAIKVSRQKGMI